MRRLLVLAILFTLPSLALAQQKTLHWRSVDVTARLEASGKLHVSERQAMVFTGDWNGGERTFYRGPEGTLEVDDIVRIASDGSEHQLIRGGLSEVDHWDMVGDSLRWRSRLSSDPPFQNKEITYRIDYTMSNILLQKGGDRYVLSHDFGFPNRPGIIKNYSLHLDIDPAWESNARAIDLDATNVLPGQSTPVRVELTYRGSGHPAAISIGAPFWLRRTLLAILFGGVGWMFIALVREERRKGRLNPLPVALVDESWLKANIFTMRPEVVGAAWDESTGAAEVAAVLARMAQEGKLASRVEKTGILRRYVLHLHLKVDRDSLDGYEKALIDALFFAGDSTDTDMIRAHYRKTGFDPASKIESGLKKALQQIPRWSESTGQAGSAKYLLTIGGPLALLVVALFAAPREKSLIVAGIIFAVVSTIVGSLVAALNRNAVTAVRGRLAAMLLVNVPLLVLILRSGWPSPLLRTSSITLGALTAIALGIAQLIFEIGRANDDPDKLRLRRRMATAREYFRRQLRLKVPALRDEWFPYLLGFGLGTQVDQWFRAFGSDHGSPTAFAGSLDGDGHPSFASSWSGGGGAFGGAGASGSWAVAAGSLAAGVSAQNSGSGGSGGGGGGGGGGSSSGGGGGGGW